MKKQYLDWFPFERFLFPPSPTDWLPDDHLAYFILDLVFKLDLSRIEGKYQVKDARGQRPYHPAMMTALLLYAYCVGVPSSRRIERATYEDVAFRVIAGGAHPDHTVISEFRRKNLTELGELFLQVLELCQKLGMVKLGYVSLDGTKVEANASKHKAMSYERMLKKKDELAREVKALLAEAGAVDAEEDKRYGREAGLSGDIPEDLRRRQTRLERISRAIEALEAEAAAARARQLAERAREAEKRAEGEDSGVREEKRAERIRRQAGEAARRAEEAARKAGASQPDVSPREREELPRHQVPTTAEGKPTSKAQRNFTDPDSRIMKRDGGYIQGYNGQIVVDSEFQLIVATGLTNQPADAEHYIPMIEKVEENCGRLPEKVSADAGYWSEENWTWNEEREVDAYIATSRQKHGEELPPIRGRPPEGLTGKQKMQRKVRTKRGREVYGRRKAVVEPVFGQMRTTQRLKRFLLRGLKKASGEWDIYCLTHNVLKMYRAQMA